jgi:hypothetical protein
MGAVDQGSSGYVVHSPYQANNEWGLYGQDDFRVTPNVTLNYGLRWDIFQWPCERHDDVANWDLNAMNPDVPFKGRLVYFGTPLHPSCHPFPAHLNDLGPRFGFAWSPFANHKTVIRGGYGMIYSDLFETLIAPQDGFASQTAFSQSFAYNGDFTGQRPAFKLSNGAPPTSIPSINLQRQQDAQFLGVGGGGMFRGSKDPYVEQWSFFIERQLPKDMMLSVGYVGTHGTHLIGDSFRQLDYVPTATRLKLRGNINNPIPTNAALGPIYGCPADPTIPNEVDCPAYIALLPYPQYPSITDTVSGDGFNDYNSFQMRFEKRYSQGLDLLAAYTAQKNIVSANLGLTAEGNLSPTTLGGRALGRSSFVRGGFNGSGVENLDDRNAYIALAPDDIPQILNLAATYELPVGAGKRFLSHGGALSKILGGWTLTQNWNFQSGVPLGFTAPCNAISCTPNLIGNPSAGRGGKTRSQLENQWFNPNAFEAPFGSNPTVIQEVTTGLAPDGTPLNFNTLDPWWQFGNAGFRLPLGRAPGFWNSDMALTKDFHFSESRYLEFQWQVFNAFNHQNLGIPDTNWCLPPGPNGQIDAVHQAVCNFGLIDNVQTDPRAMEFGLKFSW